MISEGLCDTEVWHNDAENSALITGINYTFKIYLNTKIAILNCNNISKYYCFYYVFIKQIKKSSLDELKNTQKLLTYPKLFIQKCM